MPQKTTSPCFHYLTSLRRLARFLLDSGSFLVFACVLYSYPSVVPRVGYPSMMYISAEAIIAIVSLVIATPCTVVLVWTVFRRRPVGLHDDRKLSPCAFHSPS